MSANYLPIFSRNFHLEPVGYNSGIESKGQGHGESGQGKLDNLARVSAASASLCKATLIVAHMAGTPIFTLTSH